MLNRFANATWKAGQPFKDLNRITRPSFISASSLSKEEVDKDFFQIQHSAEKLLSSMKDSPDSLPKQMELIRRLLQDTTYAVEMASYLYSSHDTNDRQNSEPFLMPGDDTATIKKRRGK